MRMLSLGIFLVFAAVTTEANSSEMTSYSSHSVTAGSLERACQPIKTEIGDCGCAAHFLQERLGSAQGLLLLKVWAAGERRDTSQAFAAIYREHNEYSVLQTTSAFLEVSADFRAQCKPPGAMFSEDRQVLVMSDPWTVN